ncbi:MAG TPA: two-component regulator propeller domain-containing protein [Blastocatellia bacterium]|nr:two-component regulator propeller domain-containing protein [Blastocatellia bacterium]
MSRCVAVLLGGGLLAGTAWGQYRFDHWTTEHGLPQNSVLAVTQTRDGYLWLATYNGLVRFDGVRFTVFDKRNNPGLLANSCSVLYEDAAGALWVGMVDGGVTRYDHGGFTGFTTAQGVPRGGVRQIQGTSSGEVLVTTGTGSARRRNGWFEPEPGSETEFRIHLGRSGTRWSLERDSLLARHGDQIKRYALPHPTVRTANNTLYEDSRGRLWLSSVGHGLLKIQDGTVIDYTRRINAVYDDVVQYIFEDNDGTFWFGTVNSGLIHFRDEPDAVPTRYSTADGLSNDTVNTIYRDREGILWIGTSGGGLNRLAPQFISGYSTAHGLDGNVTHAVLADRADNIWVATHVGLSKIAKGKVTNYSAAQGLPLTGLQSLYEDHSGRLWIGSANGLCSFKDGVFSSVVPNLNVWAMLEDQGGQLWVGTHYGLFKFKDGVKTGYTTRDGLPSDTIKAIYEDRQGTLWFGTEGGLVKYQNDRFTVFTTKDGLSSDRVWTIYEDADGVMWLGTFDGGLIRFKDGRFTAYATAQGLCDNTVFQILEDARGNLWMSCYRGLYSVSKRQLNDLAEGRLRTINCASYGKADGMLSSDCNGGRQPSGVKTADGRLWFTTLGGVAVVNPDGLGFNPLPPPVRIEEVKIDNAVVAGGAEIRIQPGQANLEIRYTGLSFIKPAQMRFRYKLIGQDQDWIEAGARRVANYSYLSPSTYTFQVLAANSDGVWSETGASLRVVVVPPFYRTWWFRSLAALAVAGLVALIYQVRVARLRKEHAAKEAFSRQLLESREEFSRRLLESQEAERKRIAAELHDGLGQNLLIIKNHALLGLAERDDATATEENLTMISEMTSQALDETRQIAYNLRPYQIDRFGLTKALQSMLNRVADVSEIEFHHDVTDLDGLFSKDAEMNLYRIVQECINNILKHSRAIEAHVDITRDEQCVRLRIADNGQGFALSADAETSKRGFGLTGLAERARMLGGQFQIQSAPGRGTVITIYIALPGKQA